MSRPALYALAERAGILPEYERAGTGERQPTSDATRVALLRALGMEAGEEGAARRALEALAPEAPPAHPADTPRCVAPEERLGSRRVFGLWANLYSLRSARGHGVGDLTDLRALVRFAGALGADFVGLNPLHVTHNRPPHVSPYSPVSRLFRNPIYLDAEALPELAESPEARRLLDDPRFRSAREATRSSERVDYAGVTALLRPVLEALHRSFFSLHRGRSSERGEAYRRFRRRQGSLLDDFASFLALGEALGRDAHDPDWRRWPEPFRHPRSPAVREFRERNVRAVDFHAFLQFELDRQLEAAAEEARRAGLRIGLYQDLALGSAGSSFDAWAFPGLFVHDVHVGAPPDPFAREGQDWGLPPLDPRRLEASGFEYWRRLLDGAFEHAGALRIDHVMGLSRQFWVPRGHPASEGAYVRFPEHGLLSVLAEESRRHDALVVGEDLGTVPAGFPDALARFGVLSSQVLLFEREPDGEFRPASGYSPRALVTANTHDLPTLPALWTGRDLELRGELGLIPDAAALARARTERDGELRALLRRLHEEGVLPEDETAPDVPALCSAVHRFLCRTPAPLVGASLDDLAGEVEPVNVPGVGFERHPSWTRRMRLSIEEIARDPDVARAAAGLQERAGSR